jgi:uncharacterized repeat protein (TIGR01451 family)
MSIRTGALFVALVALTLHLVGPSWSPAPSAQAMQEPTITATVPAVATPTVALPTATLIPTATVELPTASPTLPAATPTATAPADNTPTPITTTTPAPTSTATAAADLIVTLEDSPDVILDGGVVSYFVTVSNVGTAPSVATTLLDQLPANIAIEAIGPGCGPTPVGIVCSVPALQPGQNIQFAFTVSAQGGPGTIVNTVLVDPGNQVAELNESNNGATNATAVVPLAGPPPFPPEMQPYPPVAVPEQPPAAEIPPSPPVAVVPAPPIAAQPPVVAAPPTPPEVAGVEAVPAIPDIDLWLQVLNPTQAYTVDMEPVWVAMPGEWYQVAKEESGWALAVWNGDPSSGSVWMLMDDNVQASVYDATNSSIARNVWLRATGPTEAFSATSMEVAWITSPGEWYRVLDRDGDWVFAVYETDGLSNAVWIRLDSRTDLVLA